MTRRIGKFENILKFRIVKFLIGSGCLSSWHWQFCDPWQQELWGVGAVLSGCKGYLDPQRQRTRAGGDGGQSQWYAHACLWSWLQVSAWWQGLTTGTHTLPRASASVRLGPTVGTWAAMGPRLSVCSHVVAGAICRSTHFAEVEWQQLVSAACGSTL